MPNTTLLDELLARWRALWNAGHVTPAEELCHDCPELIPALQERIEQLTTLLSVPEAGVVTPTELLTTAGTELPPEVLFELRPAKSDGELGRLGPYRVLKVLGVGGMGRVYLAEDPVLRRRVALKVMLPKLAADPVAKGRFLREAQAAAAVEHEHVVAIHQVGEDGGVPYIAMQFLEGEPLDARLARAGRLPPGDAVRVAREVAEGLAAAHARGLIHRDVKPANVWLDWRGRVKVLDFGLARPAHEDSKLSRPGEVVGTPAYMAPEHASGHPLDARADLFSLGCLLYEALTGRAPFRGVNAMATLASVLRDMPPDPASLAPGVPPALSALLARLLAKSPEQRPGSAREVARALAAIEREAAQQSVGSPTPNPWADIDLTEPLAPPAGSQPISDPNVPGVTESGRTSAGPGGTARRGRRRQLALVGLVVAACLLLALVAPSRRPRTGFLVVDSDDPDAELTIRQGDAVIRDRISAREIELPVGEYAIEVSGARGRVSPDPAVVTIYKGRSETVWLRRERAPVARKKEPPPGPGPDRIAAEWVIKSGGYVHLYYGQPERFLEFVKSVERLPRGPLHIVLVMIAGQPSEADLEILRPLTRLGVIGFGVQEVTDGMLKRLAEFPAARQYSHLILPAARLTDAGMAALERFAGLTTLILSGCRVQEAGLDAIARLPALELLEMPGGTIEDAGLARLARSKSLRSLNLSRTRVTDAGLKELGRLGSLRAINLDGTAITDKGVEGLNALADLADLNLAHTQVADDGLATIARLPALDSLNLSGLPVTDAGLARLRPLTSLKALVLTGTRVTDAGMTQVAGFTELRHLSLDQTVVTDAGLERLSRLEYLRQLRLRGTRVTAAGVKNLRAAIPGLTVDSDTSGSP